MMNRLNFSWIIDGKLAGHSVPDSVQDIAWLKNKGIRTCVRMAEGSTAKTIGSAIVDAVLIDYHEPVPDFTARHQISWIKW